MPSWRIRTAEDVLPVGTSLIARERLIDYLSWLGLLVWLDADESAMAALIRKLDVAGDEREERVVLALANVFAGLVPRTALAHENRACVDELAAEALYAEPLSVRIAAVCRGAAAFLMCHDSFPYLGMGRSMLRHYKFILCPNEGTMNRAPTL
jgi:hypothetical protein